MEEIWKPVSGYEGFYEVSNLGRVKSLSYRSHNSFSIRDCVRKLSYTKKGYLSVGLQINKIYKRYQVHRLVAQIFIPNQENKPQVNHKNGIKDDNRVENLEWVTNGENQKHSYKALGKISYWRGKKGQHNTNSKPVAYYDESGNKIIFESVADAFLKTNIRHISEVCLGKRPHARGIKWFFI